MQNIQSYPNPYLQVELETKEKATKQNKVCQKTTIAVLAASIFIAIGAGVVAGVASIAFPIAIAGVAAIVAIVAYKVLSMSRNINAPLKGANFGWGRLHKAASKGQVMMVKLLLLLGANPNGKSGNGDKPLHMACFEVNKPNSKDHLKVMKLLIKAGANINAAGNWGRSPLHFALETRHIDRVDLLIDQGAYINLKQSCNPDFSPWQYAESKNLEKGVWSRIVGDPRTDEELMEADRRIYNILKEKGKVYQPE